jgi:hypothetical protein
VNPSATETLCVRLDACAWRLGQGREVPASELRSLAEAVADAAAYVSEEERNRLLGRVAAVTQAIEARQQAIGGQLGQMRQGRRVVRRYHEHGGR